VRLLKRSLLQFQYDLSDSQVVRQAQVNVAFRFFLDLSVESPLPVPSLLSQFRTRLGVERFTQIFNEILRQARAQGLVKDRLRLKDATHLIANIAIPSTLQLVAQNESSSQSGHVHASSKFTKLSDDYVHRSHSALASAVRRFADLIEDRTAGCLLTDYVQEGPR